MKTLILSSSLSEDSKSYLLCKKMQQLLDEKGVNVTFLDARQLQLLPCHRGPTSDMENLADQVAAADNIIIGMGVYCYSLSDSLKLILDNCFSSAGGKFFGLLCAAKGQKSYLAAQHVTQICMNEWRMMQLPRVVYATGDDFDQGKVVSLAILEHLEKFAKEFFDVAKKLIV